VLRLRARQRLLSLASGCRSSSGKSADFSPSMISRMEGWLRLNAGTGDRCFLDDGQLLVPVLRQFVTQD
jgi:hypothetical protein